MCPLTRLPRLPATASGRRPSLLTRGTIIRRALALGDRTYQGAAAPAAAAGALVDVQALAEIARRAVGPQVIAQRGAARADRPAQHGAHRAREPRGLGARQRAGRAPRADARAKQRLARVDVADADHQA